MSLPKKLPDGFVYVSEVCSSIQVDLMYSTDDNFTGSIVPGYKKNVAIMTEKAALQLAKVQDHLSTIGLGLKIKDSYRPQDAILAFKKWSQEPEDFKMFKFTVSTNRVDYIVTNNKTQKSSKAAQDEFGFRWVIESMHREIKQLTGIERCQCRKQRIQLNHISCAFLVWALLKRTANKIGKTVYQLK